MHVEYLSRFFRLADLFLSSTYVPPSLPKCIIHTYNNHLTSSIFFPSSFYFYSSLKGICKSVDQHEENPFLEILVDNIIVDPHVDQLCGVCCTFSSRFNRREKIYTVQPHKAAFTKPEETCFHTCFSQWQPTCRI